MSNLLPLAQQKQVRSLYRWRIVSTVLYMSTSVVLLSCAFVVVSFFVLEQREKSLEVEIMRAEQAKQNIEKEDFSKTINTVREELKLFSKHPLQTLHVVNDVVMPIMGVYNDTISISRIGYAVQTVTPKIEIRGIAKDRASLLSFVNKLRTVSNFRDVAVPISSFAEKDTLDFIITFELSIASV